MYNLDLGVRYTLFTFIYFFYIKKLYNVREINKYE
jgi:hypothetical protein